jgi:signal transduction histidine kinase
MKQRFPFAIKLGLSFAIVILVSVALVYFFTATGITTRFATFSEQNKQQIARQVCSLLGEYRARTGNWIGVNQLLSSQQTILVGGKLIVRRTFLIPGSFSLANEQGTVFISTEQGQVGITLSPTQMDEGIPIEANNARVGTLLLDNVGTSLAPAEEEFLASAKRSALLGGAIAFGLALLLSVLLISEVLSPLRVLTRATEQIARGDLTQRVKLKARDEFGQLGDSFNRMIKNLRHSEEIRRSMTADIAHELRTPVTIIQGNLEAILDEIYEPTTDTIAPIYEETLRLGQLIDDLRDISLAEAKELQLNIEPIQVVASIKQLVETISASLDQGPQIRVGANSTIPQVPVDLKRFQQVLVNLLTNAIRFTPQQGTIHIQVLRKDQEVEVRVANSGPGISPEEIPHLFERFYRGDQARSRGQGGSGLGLAISKQLVEAHGGRIWAENDPSGGAIFVIRLPLA